jgi:Tol biopolymer transport system component
MKPLVNIIYILLTFVLVGCSQGSHTNTATTIATEAASAIPQNTATLESTRRVETTIPTTSLASPTAISDGLVSFLVDPAKLLPDQYITLWVHTFSEDKGDEDYIGLISSKDHSLEIWIKVNLSSPYQWLAMDGSTLILGTSLNSSPSYLVDVQSGKVTELNNLSGCLNASLSPSSQKLVASCYSDDLRKTEIYIIDLEIGSKTQLTDCYPEICVDPKWSPNGNTIAYIRAKQSNGELSPTEGVYVMNVNCTDSLSCVGSSRGPFRDSYSIAWSPDGKHVSVGGWDESQSLDGSVPKRLFVYKLNGQNLNLEKTYSPDAAYNMEWSPDGKLISFNEGPIIYIFSLDSEKIIFEKQLFIASSQVLGWLNVP